MASEVRKYIEASAKLGLRNVPVLSGGFAWHLIYLWPQWPPGLIDEAFKELVDVGAWMEFETEHAAAVAGILEERPPAAGEFLEGFIDQTGGRCGQG